MNNLRAGVASVDISPPKGLRLRGYPHHPRYNTGIHDPLYGSCLILDNGETELAVIALDLVGYGKQATRRLREAATRETGIPADHIMVACSHTHSGPWSCSGISVDFLKEDIKCDPDYLSELDAKLIDLVREAHGNRFEAQLGLGRGICGKERDIGGNRRDPDGPADPEVWTLGLKDRSGAWRACVVKYALHPTVLQADNTLVSADYPGYIRQYLQERKPGIEFLFLQGTAGNQSSRYFRRDQSFAETQRFGEEIGAVADQVLEGMTFSSRVPLVAKSAEAEIIFRELPTLEQAQGLVAEKKEQYDRIKASGAPYGEVQTADRHFLGAEDTLAFVRHFDSGKSIEIVTDDNPAEIQVIGIGDARLVGFQGEPFVEYGLEIKRRSPFDNTTIVEMANGRLPGYLCTPEAFKQGGYEAGVSLVDPRTGARFVELALKLLAESQVDLS